jgi:phosphopantothenoylcysteine decarboxylase/phosphopantothenate--cysteine ligase
MPAHATAKRTRKNADWLLANNVLNTGIMGGANNEILFLTKNGVEHWPLMDKSAVAAKLAEKIKEASTSFCEQKEAKKLL